MSETSRTAKRGMPRKLIGGLTFLAVAATGGLFWAQDKGGNVAKPHPTTTSTPHGRGGGEQIPEQDLSSWVTKNPNVRAAVALALDTTVESITDQTERSRPGDQGLTWWSPDKKREIGITIGDRFLQLGKARIDQLDSARALDGAEKVTLTGAEGAFFSKSLGTLAVVSGAAQNKYISITLSDRDPAVADGGMIGPTSTAKVDCISIAAALIPTYFNEA